MIPRIFSNLKNKMFGTRGSYDIAKDDNDANRTKELGWIWNRIRKRHLEETNPSDSGKMNMPTVSTDSLLSDSDSDIAFKGNNLVNKTAMAEMLCEKDRHLEEIYNPSDSGKMNRPTVSTDSLLSDSNSDSAFRGYNPVNYTTALAEMSSEKDRHLEEIYNPSDSGKMNRFTVSTDSLLSDLDSDSALKGNNLCGTVMDIFDEQEASDDTALHANDISDPSIMDITETQPSEEQALEMEDGIDTDNEDISALSTNTKLLKIDDNLDHRTDSGYYGSLDQLDSQRHDDDQNRDGACCTIYALLSMLAVLGLQNCFVGDFFRLPCDLRHHRDDEDWIMIFLEKNFYAIQDENFRQNLSEDLLDKIGFVRGSNAVLTILTRSKAFLQNHLDPIDTVKRFVIDEFRYSPDLSNQENKEDRQKEPKETFIIDSVITLEGNILENAVLSKQVMAKIEELRQDSQFEVWFHGTDSRSAKNISWRGIIASMGSPKRDFSDGKGFYLTKNFEDAKMWAFSITQKPAVLIFKILKSCLETAKKLNLFEASQMKPTWEDTVKDNRLGILSWEMRTKLEEYDFIEGPVSVATETNSVQEVDSGAPKMTLRKARPQSHQICIINDDFADAIDEYISNVAVLYNVLGEQDILPSRPMTGQVKHDQN